MQIYLYILIVFDIILDSYYALFFDEFRYILVHTNYRIEHNFINISLYSQVNFDFNNLCPSNTLAKYPQ